jgi:hypothetical protein
MVAAHRATTPTGRPPGTKSSRSIGFAIALVLCPSPRWNPNDSSVIFRCDGIRSDLTISRFKISKFPVNGNKKGFFGYLVPLSNRYLCIVGTCIIYSGPNGQFLDKGSLHAGRSNLFQEKKLQIQRRLASDVKTEPKSDEKTGVAHSTGILLTDRYPTQAIVAAAGLGERTVASWEGQAGGGASEATLARCSMDRSISSMSRPLNCTWP